MEQEDIVYENGIKYSREIKTVPFGGKVKTITVINLTPILTPKERERRKKEIEQRLYDVFSKHQNRKG